MAHRGVWFGVVAVLLVAGVGYAWYDDLIPSFGSDAPSSHKPKPRLSAHVQTVQQQKIPVVADYTGTVISPRDTLLRARVTGYVVARPFKPGTEVAEGDVLFRIDPRPYEVALAAATGQRDQAQADLHFAEADVQRYRPLAKRGFASQQRLQQALRDQGEASGRVAQASAQIAQDQLNLNYSVVRAPHAGRAGVTDVNVGDLVIADQTQLVRVVQLDPIDIQVALSVSDADAVRSSIAAGNNTMVRLLKADGTPRKHEARIYQVDSSFDSGTARLVVRAILPNASESLLPGEFLHVQVLTGTAERLLVPTVALSSELNQQTVFLVHKDGTVRSQVIETGGQHGSNTAVEHGLHAGQMVATDHLQKLNDGEKIDIIQDGDEKHAQVDAAASDNGTTQSSPD